MFKQKAEHSPCWDKVGNRRYTFALGDSSAPSAAPHTRKLQAPHQDGEQPDKPMPGSTISSFLHRNLLQSKGSKSSARGTHSNESASSPKKTGFDYGVYNPAESIHVVHDASQPRLRKVKSKNLVIVAGVMLNQKRTKERSRCSLRFQHLSLCRLYESQNHNGEKQSLCLNQCDASKTFCLQHLCLCRCLEYSSTMDSSKRFLFDVTPLVWMHERTVVL